MGNCWGSKSVDVNPSFSNTEPSTPATTQKTNLDTGILGTSNGYSTGGGLSGTTNSSTAQSGFSVAASDDGYANGEILPSSNLKVYTFADMKSATRGFKSDSVLGIGGFGTVFKGWVDEKTLAPARSGAGMVVAIKKLNHESMQGFQEWQSEVNFLGRLSHPNLVKLLGYCGEDEELLLVYEFLSKGSLENHLFRRSSTVEPLSWDIRIKIALGAARGLAFLHGSEKKIIYRDFKASNILLDADYNAKISDFGLAKLGPSVGESHVTTRIMGTYGYAAPEYIATGHLYVQSDVYGFGVVLLELLSGLRVHDSKRPVGNINLVEWMYPLLRSKRKVLKSVMDASIKGRYSTQAAVQTARITLKCLEPDPRKRVSMKRVVQALEEIEALKIEVKEPRQVPWRHYSSGHLYVKSDVYGFGVVLLELLSGLRALDSKRPTGQVNLVEWMKPLLYSKRKLIKTVMDRRIEGQYSTKAAVEASQLTLRCLEPEPRKRASMKEVVEALEAIEALKIKAKEPRNVSSRHGSSGSSKTNPYGASRSVYRGSSR